MRSKEAPIGTRYGRLTVEGYDGPYALVLCDCGARKRVRNKHLLDGSTKSCGCLNRETREENFEKLRASQNNR